MSMPVKNIKFGEIDAKNEVFEQGRTGSHVFKNSFQIPPGIEMHKLTSGAKYFIHGQKGCGKTALLLYLKSILDESNCKTKTILFKSGITEPERQKIAAGQGFQIVQQNDIPVVEYDYKINWLWYIYRNLLREVSEDQVFEGKDTLSSLKRLLGIHAETSTSFLSDLTTKRIKAHAKAGIGAGPFSGEIGAEIEAVSQNDENIEIEIIEIVERHIGKVKIYPRRRTALLFDELELFWNKTDQRSRDLFLIRDLLYAVSRCNQTFGMDTAALMVVACVRSEVLHEVNRVGPEISRDVDDFGVRVNWNVTIENENQPILRIVEAKINASEIESDEEPTHPEEIWVKYFPRSAFGRKFKQYILDNAMFKPRNIVNMLTLARDLRPDDHSISFSSIDQVQLEFSKRTWREIEEELSGEYSSDEVAAIKSTLIGFASEFDIPKLQKRIDHLSKFDPNVHSFSSKYKAFDMITSLYRVGAIGNLYFVGSAKKEIRFGWIFRDNYDPLYDKKFMVHESLRKFLQLSFRAEGKK